MVHDQSSNSSSSCNTSITNKSDNTKPLTKEDLIHELNTADVLLGRGTPTVNYAGNVAFRQLIKQRKAEYTASSKHKVKELMAREIMTQIMDKGGRFLRCVDPVELEPLGLSLPPPPPDTVGDQKVWAAVDEEVALEKIKQALRDKDRISYYRSRAKAAMAIMKQKHDEKQALEQQALQQQQQLVSHQQRHPSLPQSSNNHLLQGGGGSAMNNHRGPSPLLGLPQGIVMQHLMNQHNTSMVMAHLQQQMQRKQLIKDLLFMEDQNRRAEAALFGGTAFNMMGNNNIDNPHHYDDLKALAVQQQQQHQQQPLFALANHHIHNNVVPPPAPASSAAFLYR